ncbi:MAG TPA: hypothetical protein VNM92_14265 [Thermoanaerobaculia bacterium]|nr:hypothetical protein [Thermoanaerobaculia bacterium]
MSEKKKWGSTVRGWFIVQDETSEGAGSHSYPSMTADQEAMLQDDDQDEQPLEVFRTAPPQSHGGQVDFDQVYQSAGVEAEERQRIERTLELLNSLPPGTDETVKKQIVLASLRAFGVPIENIIESGAEELQALEAYIRAGAKDTEQVTAEAEQRIKQYEQEIVKLRTVMQERVDEQHAVMRACNVKKLEVQKVLEFFGQEAVARVVRESPKLHEPRTKT